jgi:aminoglycoside phosphotransferase (APT) family kinase protein
MATARLGTARLGTAREGRAQEGKVPASAPPVLATGEELRAVLERRLGAVLGTGVTVGAVTQLVGGASRETWALDAVTADGRVRPLVLRRCIPGAIRADMGIEARTSTAAGMAGVPVPEVVYSTDDPSEMGGPYLLAERIEGETIARRIFRLLDAPGSVGRATVARQCGAALARLHRVAPDGLDLGDGDPIALRRETIDELGLARPAFELGLRWLEAHRPPAAAPRMVHGDFRVGNLIVGAEGLRAVLDWELVHAGDPLEDLAWFCIRAWRFGSDELVAGGLAPLDDLVAAYEAESVAPVDRQALGWWIVMGTLNWGIICAKQADRHLSGSEPSVELAAIGRRISESEWDVLECLRAAGWPR